MEKARLETHEGRALYRLPQAADPPAWEFRFGEKTITLIAKRAGTTVAAADAAV